MKYLLKYYQNTIKMPSELTRPCQSCHGHGTIERFVKKSCMPCLGSGLCIYDASICERCGGRGTWTTTEIRTCNSCGGSG